MKRLFLLVSTMILFIDMNYAQQDSTVIKQINRTLSTQYFDKGKRQVKTAVILAGSGILLGSIGVATFPRNYAIIGTNSSKTETSASISTALILTGTALLISSIPCFIVGSVNKHKAKLLIKTENLSLSPHMSLPAWQYKAGISISI